MIGGRARSVQCHLFLPYDGVEGDRSAFKTGEFYSVISGQGWEEANGREGVRGKRERESNINNVSISAHPSTQ